MQSQANQAKSGSSAASSASVITGSFGGSGAGVSTALVLGIMELMQY